MILASLYFLFQKKNLVIAFSDIINTTTLLFFREKFSKLVAKKFFFWKFFFIFFERAGEFLPKKMDRSGIYNV